MAEPFLGEIRLFSFAFAPRGWAMCNGQLLPINQNQALFSLLGATFGGDGRVNFALPNLQGRVAMSFGQGPGLQDYPLGLRAGEATHTLTLAEMAAQNHPASCSDVVATADSPAGSFWAQDSSGNVVYSSVGGSPMAATALGNTGGGQAHDNMAPFLGLNFCIALQGIFPSRN